MSCENDGSNTVTHAFHLHADKTVEACHRYGVKTPNQATAESSRDRGKIRGRHPHHEQGGPQGPM